MDAAGRVICGLDDGNVASFDVVDGTVLSIERRHAGSVWSLAASHRQHDQRLLVASGAQDASVQLLQRDDDQNELQEFITPLPSTSSSICEIFCIDLNTVVIVYSSGLIISLTDDHSTTLRASGTECYKAAVHCRKTKQVLLLTKAGKVTVT